MSTHMTNTATGTHHAAIGTGGGLVLPDAVGNGTLLDGTSVTAVHRDGGDLWVLVARRDLHRIRDGSAELVASLDDDSAGTCLGVHRGEVWVGGDDAGLWRYIDGNLEAVASFDDAPTRDEWHTPWGGPPAVFSMASDGTDLYVGVHVGGILRTADGSSWVPTIDLHDDVHQVAVGADGTVWAATGMRGLARSTDRGANWSYHTEGLHARYLLTVAAVPGGAIVGASSGHAGRDGIIYRFDGDSFTPARGLPDDLGGAVGPRQLAAAGDHAVVALPSGDVYTSADGGSEWTRVATGLSEVSEVTLLQ